VCGSDDVLPARVANRHEQACWQMNTARKIRCWLGYQPQDIYLLMVQEGTRKCSLDWKLVIKICRQKRVLLLAPVKLASAPPPLILRYYFE
jgi:hypothetical protein